MKYKLIAVDLDGTLYNDQLKITSDTLNTMIKAQEMGIRIALASGRPLPGLFHARDLLKLNEHHGMLVAYNGGKVVDTTTNEVLYDKYIPDDLAMELLEHLKDYPVNPIIDDGKVLYVTDKNGYRVKEEALNDSMEYVEVPSLTEHLDFHLNKILTAVDLQQSAYRQPCPASRAGCPARRANRPCAANPPPTNHAPANRGLKLRQANPSHRPTKANRLHCRDAARARYGRPRGLPSQPIHRDAAPANRAVAGNRPPYAQANRPRPSPQPGAGHSR